jgi:hypothetical protein
VDDTDDPGDVVDALGLGAFVSGSQPWSRTVQLHRVRDGASLLPPGTESSRSADEPSRHSHVAVGGGWTLRARLWRDRIAYVTVTAVSDELARQVLDQAVDGAVEPARPEDEAVTMGFWHRSGNEPRRRTRSVDISPWAAIRRNYATSAAVAVDRVMGLTPARLSGRLLLLHGPPGTGKTI